MAALERFQGKRPSLFPRYDFLLLRLQGYAPEYSSASIFRCAYKGINIFTPGKSLAVNPTKDFSGWSSRQHTIFFARNWNQQVRRVIAKKSPPYRNWTRNPKRR